MSDNKYSSSIASSTYPFVSDFNKKKPNCENEPCVCDVLNKTLIESYLSVIQAVIERSFDAGECDCDCSLKEKISLFYFSTIDLLSTNNDEVIVEFEKRVEENKTADIGCYDNKELLRARQMLACKLHKSNILARNHSYFRDILERVEQPNE